VGDVVTFAEPLQLIAPASGRRLSLLPTAGAAAHPQGRSGAEVCTARAQHCPVSACFQALAAPHPRMLLGPGCLAGPAGFWHATELVLHLLASMPSTKGTSDVFLDTCCNGKCPIHIGDPLGARGREARPLLEEAALPTPCKSICGSLLFSTHTPQTKRGRPAHPRAVCKALPY